MYKKISISSTLQEMMIPLKSLPVCAVVFDKYAQLIDLNQPALNFLKLKTIDEYKAKRLKVLTDCNYLVSIIKELQTGRIIQNEIYELKYPDSNSVVISFSACMLNGLSEVYLFQFFELSVSLGKSMPKQKLLRTKTLQNNNKALENKHRLNIHTNTSVLKY